MSLRGGSNNVDYEDVQCKLFRAIQDSSVDEVSTLIGNGANVNNVCPFIDPHLEPNALHFACLNNNTAMVAKLIELGGQVNMPNKRGYTALHFAALMGNLEVCQTLVQFGADLNATDALGDQPVDRAEQAESNATATWLLSQMQLRGIPRFWKGYHPPIEEVHLFPPLLLERARLPLGASDAPAAARLRHQRTAAPR